MADQDQIQGEGQAAKKGGMLKWIIVAVVVILLGGGAAWWFMLGGQEMVLGPTDPATTEQTQQDAAASAEVSSGDTQIVPLPPFLVNLADPLGRRYLKLGLEVEVQDPAAAEAITMNEARIKDSLLLLLSSKTYDSLSTMQSKVELKQDIAARLNQILGSGKVVRVYITEMVIQ